MTNRKIEDLEEGDACPEGDCDGKLEFKRLGDCSCHIRPPCGNCVSAPLTCTECGWMREDENV